MDIIFTSGGNIIAVSMAMVILTKMQRYDKTLLVTVFTIATHLTYVQAPSVSHQFGNEANKSIEPWVVWK